MTSRYRIAMYSHDTMGLGHTRRNLLIAHALAGSRHRATVLLVTGACESTAFSMPPGADCLALPALRKDLDGSYRPRRLRVALKELIAVRAKTIRAALESFEPDILIVDKVPRGIMGELDPSLESLRRRGKTRCVLGLRDVLDENGALMQEWTRTRSDEAIRDYFDAVWIYGDPAVFDPAREYGFPPAVAAKVRFTGYLDQSRWLDFDPSANEALLASILPGAGRVALCLLGGGQDGEPLGEAFIGADLPADTTGVLLTGPFMPLEARWRLRRIAEGRPGIRFVEFLPQPGPLLRRADRIVAMGGYNAIGEVLSFEKPALIVPRIRPRAEQLIRAERFNELGLLELLHPDKLSSRALSEWLARDVPAPRVRDRIDLDGLARIPDLVKEVLGEETARPGRRPSESEVIRLAL